MRLLAAILFFLSFSFLFCQEAKDNEFQKYYARSIEVIGISVENMTDNNAKMLEAIKLKPDDIFGSKFVQSMRSLKQKAEDKYNKYIVYRNREEERRLASEMKDKRLDETSQQLDSTEQELDSAIQKNTELTNEIYTLLNYISRLKKEKKNLSDQLEKLSDENKSLYSTLDEISSSLRRIRKLIRTPRKLGGELFMELPLTFRDSLQDVECGMADLIAENFSLTISSMEDNEEFIDSVYNYFTEKQDYPKELKEYLNNGMILSDSLNTSPYECVRQRGKEIAGMILTFKNDVENPDTSWSITEILMIPSIILLLLLIIAIIRISRKGKL